MMKKLLLLLLILIWPGFSWAESFTAQSSVVFVDDDGSRDPAFSKLPACVSSHPLVEGCQFKMCAQNSDIGKIYVKVEPAPTNGTCKYIERSLTMGGIDCVFKTNELGYLHPLFGKYFQEMAAGGKQFLTAAEHQALGDIFTNRCTKVGNYLADGIVDFPPNSSIYFDPEFRPEDMAKYYHDYLGTHSSDLTVLTTGIYQSLFFRTKVKWSLSKARRKVF